MLLLKCFFLFQPAHIITPDLAMRLTHETHMHSYIHADTQTHMHAPHYPPCGTHLTHDTHFPQISPLTPAQNSSISLLCEVSGLLQLIVWTREKQREAVGCDKSAAVGGNFS